MGWSVVWVSSLHCSVCRRNRSDSVERRLTRQDFEEQGTRLSADDHRRPRWEIVFKNAPMSYRGVPFLISNRLN